jgi:hypothetical protein
MTEKDSQGVEVKAGESVYKIYIYIYSQLPKYDLNNLSKLDTIGRRTSFGQALHYSKLLLNFCESFHTEFQIKIFQSEGGGP